MLQPTRTPVTALAVALAVGCSKPGEPRSSELPAPTRATGGVSIHETHSVAPRGSAPEPRFEQEVPSESALGAADVGVFGDLDARVQLPPPAGVDLLLLDAARKLLTAYAGAHPLKVYPLGAGTELRIGSTPLRLRPGDARELSTLSAQTTLRHLPRGHEPPPGDADGDGIADPLDLRIGAEKAALNGASYSDAYFNMPFPGGDAPRNRGACVDVVVRAARNAGLDLQVELHRDLSSAREVYGVERADTNIDHRRVRVVIRYFERHWLAQSRSLDDPADPPRPGDVVFLDTFPNRPGPDHVGVLAETRGKSGHPLVINNWTTGYTTRAMDLLGFVPVTHRFRFPSKASRQSGSQVPR